MDSVTLSKKTTIWHELCQSLVERYEILAAVNLLKYDDDMEQLWQELSFLQGYSFSLDQRLIFSLYDTEYYLPGSTVGFTIENLRRLLVDLDISPDYCMLFTNHHGIQKTVADLYRDFPIIVSENNFCHYLNTPTPVVLQRRGSDISRHFCFMSNIRRDHRSYIRLWLEDKNLLGTTILSWHSTGVSSSRISKDNSHLNNSLCSKFTNSHCTFIYNRPFTRVYGKIVTTDNKLLRLYRHSDVLKLNYQDYLIDTDANQDNFKAPWLSKALVNIVSETVFNYPYPYLTEKTFKCFWHRSPFVIAGASGSLSYLKSIGFKTFDNWFDESYDSIKDPDQRLIAILNTLDTISKWSLEQCQVMYNEMQPVITHNLTHYQNYFCKNLLTHTKKELQLV
jgi:hypothetical protein